MSDQSEGIRAEAKKTKETAERLANGDSPEGADHIRVLAGLIHQVAEQVERLAAQLDELPDGSRQEGGMSSHEAERQLEEDRTPEDAPAEPADDRAAS